MSAPAPAFTLGLEEEYLLVDPATGALAADPPAALLAECEALLPGQIGPEFMRCQVEVATPVAADIAAARAALAELRRSVAAAAGRHGLAIIAAGTHPFGSWLPQQKTERQRYQALAEELGTPVRRLLICALHVHVGIADPELRIDLMNQARYFLPHLLALATSSPFWQGQDTGMKSYRLAVFNELPRTGLPDVYQGWRDFQQHLDALVGTGVIQDGTRLWWDLRPSARFPTLEMRVCDIPTRLDDSITIAALFVCLLRMLWRLRQQNIAWRSYKTLLIGENRWRAMRYGCDAGLIDLGRQALVPYPALLEEILALVAEDAAALGCLDEIARARTIVERGTSADSQLRRYAEARRAGASDAEALRGVVAWLREETLAGLGPVPAGAVAAAAPAGHLASNREPRG